jgi:hypothetical protein
VLPAGKKYAVRPALVPFAEEKGVAPGCGLQVIKKIDREKEGPQKQRMAGELFF